MHQWESILDYRTSVFFQPMSPIGAFADAGYAAPEGGSLAFWDSRKKLHLLLHLKRFPKCIPISF